MTTLPARTLTFRVVTVLACLLTLLASGMWWMREAGIFVPIAGTRTTQTILELIVWTQVAAAVCLILVPWFWSGAPWPRLTVWRWQSVALPVLPWLSLALGPTFAGPTFAPQILLVAAVVTGGALTLARLQSATAPGKGPPVRTVVARVIALGVALVSILLSIGGMVLGVAFNVPVDMVRSTEGGRDVIVERHATLLDTSYEVRWVRDGVVYRRG